MMKRVLEKALARIRFWQLVTVSLCTQVWAGNAVAEDQKFHRLSATQLRTMLLNHQVSDEAHWTDSFLPQGKFGGHQLGNPQTGSWKVTRQGQLCIERKMQNTEPDCFEVWLKNNQVQYRQGTIVLTEGTLEPNDE